MMNTKRILVSVLFIALLFTACNRVPAENPISESSLSESSALDLSSSSSGSSAPSSAQESSKESSTPQSSEPSVESISSAASSVSEAAFTANPDTSSVNSFVVGKNEAYDLYLFHSEELSYGMTYSHPEQLHPIIQALNDLPALLKAEAPPDTPVQASFLVIREGYKKTQINLLENALDVDGTCYTLTAGQYDSLKKPADAAIAAEKAANQRKNDVNAPAERGLNDYGQYAQWLVWMNPERVTAIECTDETGLSYEILQEIVPISAHETRTITVTDGKTYVPGSKNFTGMKNAYKMVMTFDNGGTYTLVIAGDNLYIEASDMSIACQYKSKNASYFVRDMKDAKESGVPSLNPQMGKPVIYLYPEKTQDISVRLNYKGKFTYTYPTYNNGWHVTAAPDGTLRNIADGSTHYYLFWEGNSNFYDWDFSEGFVVKGSEIEKFLKEKLPAMGLIPREYNDFITYWVPELARNEYNLVTFSAVQYDSVAPLDISPAPDTILRVHMVYKPIPGSVSIKEQVLPKAPERNGFTVVEWGGTRAGQNH